MTYNTQQTNSRVIMSTDAISFVTSYELSKKNLVENVSNNKKYIGGDLLITSPVGEKSLIEVKSTVKPNNIPNAFSTEFSNNKLVADFLYIVLYNNNSPSLYIIPRDKILQDDISKHLYYKFKQSFQNKLKDFKII